MSSLPDRSRILLFIKAPEAGQVKSRLAARIGDHAALGLYQCFVLDVLDTITTVGSPLTIFFTPVDTHNLITAWLGQERSYAAQTGSDVGERMKNAFSVTFADGILRAVLIGSDLPDLPAALIRQAFDALDDCGAVIGPAYDGGYYLIGFRIDSFTPEIFSNISWGTNKVFAETLQVFERSWTRVHILPVWRDMDTIDDLRDFTARNRKTGLKSSRTLSLLIGKYAGLLGTEDSDASLRL